MVDFGRLEALYVDAFYAADFPPLSRFLRTVGMNLKHLGFHVHDRNLWFEQEITNEHPDPDPLTHLSCLDLSILQNLHSVSLNLPAYTCTGDADDDIDVEHIGLYRAAYAYVVNISLPSLSDSLRCVTFRLGHEGYLEFHDPQRGARYIPGPDRSLQTDWSELDSALNRRITQQGLQRVQFDLTDFDDPEAAQRCVLQRLPRTRAAGVLHFVEWDELE